jgi:hypothetical protein
MMLLLLLEGCHVWGLGHDDGPHRSFASNCCCLALHTCQVRPAAAGSKGSLTPSLQLCTRSCSWLHDRMGWLWKVGALHFAPKACMLALLNLWGRLMMPTFPIGCAAQQVGDNCRQQACCLSISCRLYVHTHKALACAPCLQDCEPSHIQRALSPGMCPFVVVCWC